MKTQEMKKKKEICVCIHIYTHIYAYMHKNRYTHIHTYIHGYIHTQYYKIKVWYKLIHQKFLYRIKRICNKKYF